MFSRRVIRAGIGSIFVGALLLPVLCCTTVSTAPSKMVCHMSSRACGSTVDASAQFCGPAASVRVLTELPRSIKSHFTQPAVMLVHRHFVSAAVSSIPAPRFCNPVGTVQLRI